MHQCEEQGCSSVSAATASLLCSLLDADTRLIDPHIVDAWRAIWAGSTCSPPGSKEAACRLIAAYGDTRQLEALLLSLTTAILSLPDEPGEEEAGMRALMCSPAILSAWSAAAARLPVAQVCVVVEAVAHCTQRSLLLKNGVASVLLGRLAPLGGSLATVLAGVCVLQSSALSVARAERALQTLLDAQAREAGSEAQHAAAFLLHLSAAICARRHAITAQRQRPLTWLYR
jgi:hypothetical protein